MNRRERTDQLCVKWILKRVIIVLAVFHHFTSNGQAFEKSLSPYTSDGGFVYRVGDTLTIGNAADFGKEKFSYFFSNNRHNAPMSVTTEIESTGKILDWRFSRVLIKQFRVFDGTTYAVIDKLFGYQFDIENALKSGELVNQKHAEILKVRAPILTNEKAYLEYYKRDTLVNKDQIKEFMYLMDHSTYKNVREDEFEFNKQLKTTKKQMQSYEVDTSQIFAVAFTDKVGNYDFDRSGFPIVWNNNGAQILSDTYETFSSEDINNERVELTNLRIRFLNTNDFNFLPLNEDKANKLVKRRKNSNGDVDRTVYMAIFMKIKKLSTEDVEGTLFGMFTFKKETQFLVCEIVSIDIFEDKTPSYNWLNSIDN